MHRPSPGPHAGQYVIVQPAELLHGRELGQFLQARLRQLHEPQRYVDRPGGAASSARTLQRGPSTLKREDEIVLRVQEATGRAVTLRSSRPTGATFGMSRVRNHRGKNNDTETKVGTIDELDELIGEEGSEERLREMLLNLYAMAHTLINCASIATSGGMRACRSSWARYQWRYTRRRR
jgi:hypothetical protein